MARLLALDECPLTLRNHLLRSLRSLDEAILLPQAQRNDESGLYRNVVFRLAGAEPSAPIDIFSERWFSGISAIRIDTSKPDGARLRAIIQDPRSRAAALQKLRDAIPSEMANSELQVGPKLDGDESDRDKDEWVAGLDSTSSFVGLFLAEHSMAPEPGRRGMHRIHQECYLVCKAGAGLAGATFHARLTAALRRGLSLEECLEKPKSEPGPAALRRVSLAGSRNRARILLLAASALGLDWLDTVPDQSSRGKYRSAVTHLDVSCNVLRKAEDATTKSIYQYTTCLDASVSKGLMSLSNAADGLLLVLSPTGEMRYPLRNEAWCTLPFASMRIATDKATLLESLKAYRETMAQRARHESDQECAHPDGEFVRQTFTWKNREFSSMNSAARAEELEPLALWGTYDQETYSSRFARELGIAQCQLVRLRPYAVCVAGIDPSKLRAALRNLQ
ncbi:MAG: hypothetical protein CMM02_00760 [Rhodopirellula sp.]|jgi:hypothetical protein|nr:hypothetical protein [Rhodopirellula sp.]